MKKLLFTLLIAGVLLNVSCKKDASEAPDLPPSESLSVDFSDFTNTNSRLAATFDTTKKDHFERAVIQVAVWNTIIAVNMAVPILSFKAAFNHTPTYASKNLGWLWTYSVTNNSGTYTCKLYGKFNSNSGTDWTMLISKANVFTDVEWYTGTSKLDGTGASWTLNKNAFNVTPYLDVTWSKSATKQEIKYTSIDAGTAGVGSYIEYGVDTTLAFESYYNIFAAENNHDVAIIWNKTSKEGKVKEEKHYLDNDYRCWNTTQTNAVCK